MNIPEVKSGYEYVTELRERLEDSLKLAQEELQKSQKRYKKHYGKKTLLYIPREPEVDVVHTSNKDDATIAVARVIYQDTKPELGEVTD